VSNTAKILVSLLLLAAVIGGVLYSLNATVEAPPSAPPVDASQPQEPEHHAPPTPADPSTPAHLSRSTSSSHRLL
jgi:hypothetical protein